MRMRIEKERTPAGKDDLAIKTGKGGLVDAEFVAQALCLENGWHEANTLKALERWKLEVMTKLQAPNSKLQRSIKLQNSKGRPKKRTLSAPEWQKKGTEDRNEEEQKFERMIQGYRKLRRVEGVLRRWSYEGETVLPDDPAPYYRVAVRCGFETAEEFRKAVAEWRREIRKGYEMIMTNETPAPD